MVDLQGSQEGLESPNSSQEYKLPDNAEDEEDESEELEIDNASDEEDDAPKRRKGQQGKMHSKRKKGRQHIKVKLREDGQQVGGSTVRKRTASNADEP